MVLIVTLMMAVALLAACQPITAEDMQSALAGQPVSTESSTTVDEGAMATVTARSLRVRAQPGESAEVVAGIREGEQYEVIGRSSDGLWIELAIPKAPQGSGWVSANFVTVSGAITDAKVSSAPVASTPTAAPTVATVTEAVATAAPTEEAAEAVATAAPTEEAAEAVTAAPTEEAAEAVATAAPTEEATAAPAEETATAIAPAPGFALVTAEGARLRVRAEPSTTAEIVGWVQPGETVPVAEVSADGLWVKLGGVPDTQNPNGGWVSAEFVVLGQ
ncbi:MAG: SH3 domain-containing protein [Anaerolineales bacterium]|nr:SH3 domain-containing protein [Anaerolineales bacterium]